MISVQPKYDLAEIYQLFILKHAGEGTNITDS